MMNAPTAEQHNDTTSIALIGQKVDALTESVKELKGVVTTSSVVYVTRPEWELRNALVDERFKTVSDRAERAEQDVKSRRAPWWNAAAVAISAAAFLWVVFGPSILSH